MRAHALLLVSITCIALIAAVPAEGAAGRLTSRAPVTGKSQLASLSAMRAASQVPLEVRFDKAFPRTVLGAISTPGSNPDARARAFLSRYRAMYRIRPSDTGFITVRQLSRGPLTTVTLRQTYQGIPVYGGELSLMMDTTDVRATYGGMSPDIRIDPSPRLTSGQAEARARKASRSTLSRRGEASLVVFDPGLLSRGPSRPQLAWRIRLGQTEFMIDADDGQVLQSISLTEEVDFDLDDANGQNAASTYCYWWTTQDDQVADEDGVDPARAGDPEVTQTWAWINRAYDFYADTVKRDGFDGDDGYLEAYINASVPNASWSDECEAMQHATGWPSPDILVHEFTHGVNQHTSNLHRRCL